MLSRAAFPIAVAGLCLLVSSGLTLPQSSHSEIVALMHRAAEARRRGDYDAAAETYRRVVRRAPGFYEGRLFLADTLRKCRLDVEAKAEFAAARKLRPTDPLSHTGLADLEREAFRFREALTILEEGARVVPADKQEPIILAKGTALRQSGDAASAVQVLAQGAGVFPSSFRIREALARSLEVEGRWAEAVQAWRAARDLAPEDPSIRAGLDEATRLLSRLEQAEAAAKSPGAPKGAWGELARVRYLSRQFQKAAEAALVALRRERGRGDLTLLRGCALEKAGMREKAESELRKIPPGAPEHLVASYHRAYLARLRGDEATEGKTWLEAVESHPEDPGARVMLVLCWKREGKLEERIAGLRRSAGGRNRSSWSRVLEGLALEEAGRDDEAARLYTGLFREAPEDPEASARLTGLLALRPALLTRSLEETTSSHSSGGTGVDPTTHLLLARLLLVAGREKEALQEARETVTLFPERAEAHLALATLLEVAGNDPRETSTVLARAAALAPRSPWVRLLAGLALLRSGASAEAIREGERVVALAPRFPEGHEFLGSARRTAEDYSGAVQSLSRALLLDPTDSSGVVRFQLALAHAAQGNRLEARSVLEGGPPPFPDLIYREAWLFTQRTFLDRGFRGQDWLAWRDRFDGRLDSPAAACAAVAEMLSSLRDPYTRLRAAEETEAIYLAPRSGKLQIDRSGRPTRSSSSVVTEDLGENLGYLRLTNFTDPSAREAIRRALEELAEREGLILDLRGNTGGLSADADAIAGMLLESGEEIGRERSRIGEQPRTAPQMRPRATRTPLVILTDRRTGSAAERLAAGLQGAGRARVVGEGTFGKGTGQMSRLLPGGGMILVTAVENLTRAGEPIQGRGVLPDVKSDDALEKAKEMLKERDESKAPR